MNKFWMVKCGNSSVTSVMYKSKQEALKEADRLARANAGLRYYILEATDYYVVNSPCERVVL